MHRFQHSLRFPHPALGLQGVVASRGELVAPDGRVQGWLAQRAFAVAQCGVVSKSLFGVAPGQVVVVQGLRAVTGLLEVLGRDAQVLRCPVGHALGQPACDPQMAFAPGFAEHGAVGNVMEYLMVKGTLLFLCKSAAVVRHYQAPGLERGQRLG